ncbi:MAG: hypothetical protein K2Z81_22685, partial [Cyanobacteria bacterium]|nr:hypothetical protein [Cyanobacteriota bacterium]
MTSKTQKLYSAIAEAEQTHGDRSVQAAEAYQRLADFHKSNKDRGGQKDCTKRLRWIVKANPAVLAALPSLGRYVERTK